jgi:hypothetical protein
MVREDQARQIRKRAGRNQRRQSRRKEREAIEIRLTLFVLIGNSQFLANILRFVAGWIGLTPFQPFYLLEQSVSTAGYKVQYLLFPRTS